MASMILLSSSGTFSGMHVKLTNERTSHNRAGGSRAGRAGPKSRSPDERPTRLLTWVGVCVDPQCRQTAWPTSGRIDSALVGRCTYVLTTVVRGHRPRHLTHASRTRVSTERLLPALRAARLPRSARVDCGWRGPAKNCGFARALSGLRRWGRVVDYLGPSPGIAAGDGAGTAPKVKIELT